MATEAASESTDPELQATAWDLEPLVDGEGPEGVERRLDAGPRALAGLRGALCRQAGRARQPRAWREAMHELARDPGARSGAPAPMPALRFSTDTADPAAGALLQEVQERETAIETTLLFFELEWAALVRRARRGAAGGRGPRLLPPPPAQRAPLPRAPALRARGEDPRREVAHGRERLVAPVRGADLRDRGELPGDRTPGAATGRRGG